MPDSFVAYRRLGLAAQVADLITLYPHLAHALERDQGGPGGDRVTGDHAGSELPLNADVLMATSLLKTRVMWLTGWASDVLAEPTLATNDVGVLLLHLPRYHERLLATGAVDDAKDIALEVHRLWREIRLVLGLRTADQRLGQYCPMHDDPLTELVVPGSEGTLVYGPPVAGQRAAMAVRWLHGHGTLCRRCGASWGPEQYLLLGRMLQGADARRQAAHEGVHEESA